MLIQNLNEYANAVCANEERFVQIRLGNDLYWEAPKSYASTSSLSYSNPLIPASGGTSTPILNVSSTWGYYEKTTGGGSTGANYTVTYAFKDTAPSTWSIDSSTGVITATTMGTTTIAETPVVIVATVISTGMTLSIEGVVTQAENTITNATDSSGRPPYEYSFDRVKAEIEDVSPAGGIVSKFDAITVSLYFKGTFYVTFSSGSVQTFNYGRHSVPLDPGLSCITYSNSVIAEDIRWTAKNRTKLGTLTGKITLFGYSKTTSCDVYQSASLGNGTCEVVNLIASDNKLTLRYWYTETSNYITITRSDGVALNEDNPLIFTLISYETEDDGGRIPGYRVWYNSDGSANIVGTSTINYYNKENARYQTSTYEVSQLGITSVTITITKTTN